MTTIPSVEELQALCDAATCGPWFVVGQPWNGGPPYVISEHPDPHYGVFVADLDAVVLTNDNAAADAAFIAAARTAMPALLARLRAAEETLARFEALAGIAAAKHRPDEKRGGCECGFCAWSVEHVAIMSVRDAMDILAEGASR